MITTLNSIKNNFMLKVFGDSYNTSEAEEIMLHRLKFKDALNDITFIESCENTAFKKYLFEIGQNIDCSSKPEAILKVIKSDENISKKHEIILEFCEITSNLFNKSVTVMSKNIQGARYCDTFSPYIPIEGNATKFTEIITNPNTKITHDLFLKLADSLTISSIHYLNLILKYTSINGCLSMLTFCPKVVVALGVYQAYYFIKTQWTSPEGFYNFLIQLKGYSLQVKALAKQVTFSFLPNIYFCFGCLSGGLLGGTAYYLLSIRNAQTGSMMNMLAKIPQPDLGGILTNKYMLPSLLLPFKNAFDFYVLPCVHHSASVSRDITQATISGIIGPENLSMIQRDLNSQFRKYFGLEAVSYTDKNKNDTT